MKFGVQSRILRFYLPGSGRLWRKNRACDPPWDEGTPGKGNLPGKAGLEGKNSNLPRMECWNTGMVDYLFSSIQTFFKLHPSRRKAKTCLNREEFLPELVKQGWWKSSGIMFTLMMARLFSSSVPRESL